MLVYNITIKIDRGIEKEWLPWMQQVHIPRVLATGCFQSARVLQLMDVDEEEGPTFAVQYETNDEETYRDYLEQHAPRLRQESMDAWGDRFIAFRTVMKVVTP